MGPSEILLVDDDRIALMVTERFISRSGLQGAVKKFLNGRDALDYLLTAPHVDRRIVCLDLNMPVMNGWEFLDAVQRVAALKDLRVVLITSSVDAGDKRHALDYPQVLKYVEKPISVETFQGL